MSGCRAPGGMGRSVIVPLLLPLLILTLRLSVVAGHNGQHDKDGNCLPWICSCYYYGVYYDEGDVWESPDDPCIKYKCIHNGFFKPIQIGCSFKGECKAENSTWTENCFRYRCKVQGDYSQYVLEQSGCSWRDGNCYAVGARAIDHCDTYECQIDGGCFTMNKVKTGCKTGDTVTPCKPLYSFWQDQCAVYQCTKETNKEGNETLRARIQTHTNDVMMWPRGHYALPQPETGCPKYDNNLWKDGNYLQCGDGCNYKSQEFDLEGNYTENMFDHHFCVHHDLNDPTIMPLYQTYWDEGRYCILRYNGSCPKDFTEGYVEMSNSKCAGKTNITHGRLPDGVFNSSNTRLEFCCRYDGEIDHPIVLPAKHPFVLFMAKDEEKCQEVRGMDNKLQYWSFCDVNDGLNRLMNGSLPFIKTGDNNTLINFCVYTPIGCGCTYEDEVIAVGDEITKNCITRACKQVYHDNELFVVKGGCYDDLNEKCREENETWVDKEGEMCQTRQCIRKVSNETADPKFIIVDTGKGCRDGDMCYPLNYTKNKGCYHTQCQLDPASDKTSFVVTLAGCSDGHGNCIPDKGNYTQGCIQLRCDRGISKCGLSLVKGACRLKDGSCVEVNATAQIGCSEYACRQYKASDGYSWTFKPVKRGCKTRSGKCYKEGDRVKTQCAEYECVYSDKPGFALVNIKCKYGNNCYTEGQTVQDKEHCMKLKCLSTGHWQKIGFDCRYKKQCIASGSTTQIGCYSYKCVTNSTSYSFKRAGGGGGCKYNDKCYSTGERTFDENLCLGYQCQADGRMMRNVIGCIYSDKCYKKDETLKIKCGTYVCRSNSTHRWIDNLKSGCKINSTACVEPGESYIKDCNKYYCRDEGKHCVAKLVEKGCKDPKTGKCLEPGAQLEKNCATYKCSPDGIKNPLNFLKGGCSVDGVCYDVGDEIPGSSDCGSKTCSLRNPSKPSYGTMVKSSSGCVDNEGKCMKEGEERLKDDGSPFCKWERCIRGKVYSPFRIQCKTNTGVCLNLKSGQKMDFTLNWKGKTCDGVCRSEKNTIHVDDIKC